MFSATVTKKQANSKAIDQWLDIHFGDTSFNGRVVIGRREIKGGVYALGVRPLTTLRPYVKMLIATQSKTHNYYITANTVTGINRRKENLFGLQNIVIDIDCHDDNRQPHAIAELVQGFIWRSRRDLWDTGVIPTPNSIVRTGRGIQLWWAIVPCYGGSDYGISLYHYEKIKNNIMDHINAMLKEYSESLGALNIDRGASSNPVGYFRLPGTYNTEAKCYSAVEILHSNRYDQRELTKLERPESETPSEEIPNDTRYVPLLDSDRFILRNFQSAGVCRVLQLIKLRNLRNNEVGSEMRDYFNFSVYNALRMSFTHDQAMARLNAFNMGFKEPMTDRELQNCISSAKEKEGYKYSNVRLIELLEITAEEQEAIGLFPAGQKHHRKPNASRDAARKALREDRDRKIVELTGQGVSQAETARILGISKNTVGSVLKKLRETEEPVNNTATVIHIDDHSSRPNFGSIYVTDRHKNRPNDFSTSGLLDLSAVDSS